MSTIINLRDFYSWYTHDEFVEVSDEVMAELIADKRYERAYRRRMYYNKAHYSLDVADGIEATAAACHNNNPEVIFTMMEMYCKLCQALNSLPEKQGRRIEALYLLGMSRKEIAKAERASESSVNESIKRGLKAMEKVFSNNFQSCPVCTK